MTLIVIAVILAALFGVAFLSKRRFGILGLGLAAGVVLAGNASNFSAGVLQQQNVPVAPLSYDAAATIIIILLPALILLAGGPTYSTKRAALLGSVGFALLGTFFILSPLTSTLPAADRTVADILIMIAKWQNTIVVIALLVALIDVVMVHNNLPRLRKKHDKH